MAQRAAQPVQPPHHQGVTGPGEGEGLGEAGPLGERAGGGVGEDPFAASLGEGVLLEGQGLVGGGDAGVADQHGRWGQQPRLEDRQLAGLPLGIVPPMPTSSSRQRAALGGLVALVAVVIGIVFFATSHPLRGIVLLIVAALAAGYAFVTARR